ncbi:hypothetical protein TNCV_3547751 [Trichonephila clavipes]|nr:hypothetical protein TNCV_3547751 [Trichonephila clavipes]
MDPKPSLTCMVFKAADSNRSNTAPCHDEFRGPRSDIVDLVVLEITSHSPFYSQLCRAVGSLVVRASDSRSEGLGSVPDATKYPPSTHGVRAR